MILFRNVALSLGKSTTRFAGSRFFSEEKWKVSFDVKQRHTFSRRKSTKKKSLRSAHLTIIILFRIILPFNNDNNTIWGGSVLTGEEPPLHSGELKHALLHAGGPTQSQLSRLMSSGHHISKEHRPRRKQLNSDTNASKKNIWKKYKKKEKKKLFLLLKNEKRKWKTLKNQKWRKWTKKRKHEK